MDKIDRKKLVTSMIAIAVVILIVTLIEHLGTSNTLVPSLPSQVKNTAATSILPADNIATTTAKINTNEKININTASINELMTLRGIGPAKADAIISYRSAKGLFQQIEDIMKVSGIGKVTFENIRNNISVK